MLIILLLLLLTVIVQSCWILNRKKELKGFISGKEGDMNRSLLTFLYETADKLSLLSDELQHQILTESAFAQDSSASSEEIAAGAEEQAAALQIIDQNLSGMLPGIKKTEGDMREVLEQTEMNQKELNGINDQFSKFSQTIEQGSKSLQDISTEVTKFNQRIENIENILANVDDVAEQTNLLALNASIEAARAGNAGKGFAVVAEEIRKLSTETQKLSENIKSINDQTRNDLNQIIENVQDISTDFLQAAKNSQVVNRSLQEVSVRYDEFSGVFAATVAMLSQQLSGMQAIGGSVNELNLTSEEITGSIEIITNNISQLAGGINGLEEPAGILQSTARALYQRVKEEQSVSKMTLKNQQKIEELIPRLIELVDNIKLKEMDLEFISGKLKRLVEQEASIELFALVNPAGKLIQDLISIKVKTENTAGISKKHRTWFKEAITGKDYFISEPYFSSITEQPCITLSIPVKQGQEVIAVLAADIQV